MRKTSDVGADEDHQEVLVARNTTEPNVGTPHTGSEDSLGHSKIPSVMTPLGPLAASATIVNLVLATGPFSYPQGFVGLGPVLSLSLLVFSCFISYVTATFMIEAIAVANAEESKNQRRDSMFESGSYKSPIIQRKTNLPDLDFK